MLCLKVISARKQTKQCLNPFYRAYVHQAKIIQEALNRLSAHSLTGHAIVIAINTAVILLKSIRLLLNLDITLAASSTGFSKAKQARILTREEGSRASAERERGDWKRAQSASGGAKISPR